MRGYDSFFGDHIKSTSQVKLLLYVTHLRENMSHLRDLNIKLKSDNRLSSLRSKDLLKHV